ncbi:MAG: TMEM165/GDT1 family protein [Pseudomonadota bacterium]
MLDSLLLSFGIVFLAEMGDKSQLISLAFATRYRAVVVLAAISVASLLLSAASTLVGAALALAIPTDFVKIAAGLVFLLLAPLTLRNGGTSDGEKSESPKLLGIWAPLTIGGAFFLAEFGDKTMLVTMTLAATEEAVGVWLGSALGMVAANAIAVAIGAAIGTRIPERWIRRLAAAAFVIFGVILIGQGAGLF